VARKTTCRCWGSARDWRRCRGRGWRPCRTREMLLDRSVVVRVTRCCLYLEEDDHDAQVSDRSCRRVDRAARCLQHDARIWTGLGARWREYSEQGQEVASRQWRVCWSGSSRITADIYSVALHVGRGGWTLYTGSAGWPDRAGIEAILGSRRLQGAFLLLPPCIRKASPRFRDRPCAPRDRGREL
jgi:hypothetical protein